MEEVVGLNSTCWSKGRGGVKKAMSVKGIMLKCKGRGNSSDGLKHGGEGNGIGSHAAIGGVAELGGSCACCMCTLLGGEAVAVASNMALASLGSDTGGSVRHPAAFCGVVGMKPTYGGVSRYGLIAAVSSFDVIGPIAKTLEDTQIIFDVIKGNDILDSTSVPDNFYKKISPKKELIIGVPWDLINQEGISPDIKKNFEKAVKSFENLGYKVKDIKLPNCLALYYIIKHIFDTTE